MNEEKNLVWSSKVSDLTVDYPNHGIYASSLGDLKDWLESARMNDMPLDEWVKNNDEDGNNFALRITLECGCEKRFKYLKDIPLKSQKCKHGNYFIRIGGENDKK